MELVHEAFHQQDAGGLGRGDHGLRFRGVHGQGFLAEDVLAGPQGPDGPLGVEVVRQGDVDGVDGRVLDEVLVRPEGAVDVEADRPVPGPGFVPGGDGGQEAVPRCEDGRDEGLLGDPGAPQDAPPDLPVHHRLSAAYYEAKAGRGAIPLRAP